MSEGDDILKKLFITIMTCFLMMCTGIPVCLAQGQVPEPASSLRFQITDVVFAHERTTAVDGQKATIRKDHIGWRYKVINGDLYRRKYNYTTHTWIGKWERV